MNIHETPASSAAGNNNSSIASDATVELCAFTATDVESSYFHRSEGAAAAVMTFVMDHQYGDPSDTDDECAKKFIDFFCVVASIDLGVEYTTPDRDLEWLDRDLNHIFEIVMHGWFDTNDVDLMDRLDLLDTELLSRHLPSYVLPWRGSEKLYWPRHLKQLIAFVIKNPLLERALRTAN
jgi:hypothetical protein